MKFLILTWLTYQSISRLLVVYPKDLASQFIHDDTQGQILFDRANFGYYPQGNQFNQIAVLSGNINGCNPFNQTLGSPFIIVRQGNCSFVSQAKNIQNAGGSMAIIISENKKVQNNYVLANDGYGFQISIATIFIGNDDGLKLVRWIEAQTDPSLHPQLNIVFPMKHSEKAQVTRLLYPLIDLAVSINDRQSFKMVRELQPYLLQMEREQMVKLDVYYQIYSCGVCSLKNYTEEMPHCLGGGKYCAEQPQIQEAYQPGTGRDILFESIRQTCLLQRDPRLYFNYIQNFDAYCFHPSQYDFCSQQLLMAIQLQSKVQIVQQIQRCFRESFNQSQNQLSLFLQTNTILDKQFKFKKYSGMSGFPGLTINGRPYVGNLETKYIMESICESISYKSESCREFPNYLITHPLDVSVTNEMEVWQIILIVLAIVIMCGILMFKLYDKIIKRQVQQQTSQQVNAMVEQYIEFYESKSNNLVQ